MKIGLFFTIIVMLLLKAAPTLFATYCIDASSEGNVPIKYVKVMSERCSGSNYTRALIRHNINGIEHLLHKYGIEHFSPWFGYEDSYFGPERDYTFEGNENVLFILLFRDPYDWLRSFKRQTFFGPAELQVCTFSEFIRGIWGMNSNYDTVRKYQEIHPLIDLNPSTGEPFKNVIEMREAKIRNMLLIPSKVKNYYVINYENTRDYPEEVIAEIAEMFHLEKKPEFTPITKRRGVPKGEDYAPREYSPISKEDFEHINSYLDRDLERSIGYELRYTN